MKIYLIKLFTTVALLSGLITIFSADLKNIHNVNAAAHTAKEDALAKASLELFMKNMAPFNVDTNKNIAELQAFIPTLGLSAAKLKSIKFVLGQLFGYSHKSYWYDYKAKDVLAKFWFFAAHFNKPGGYQNPSEKNPKASDLLKEDIIDAIYKCEITQGAIGGIPYVACFTGKSQAFLSKIQGYMPGIILDSTADAKEKAHTSFTLFFKHADQQPLLFDPEAKRSQWIAAAKKWTKNNTMNLDPEDQNSYYEFFLEELTEFMDNQELPTLEEENKKEQNAQLLKDKEILENKELIAFLKTIPNKNLKLYFKNKIYNDSYQGLIYQYTTAINNKNTALAKAILNTLKQIAYTNEAYAARYAYVNQFLTSSGFSHPQITGKLATLN